MLYLLIEFGFLLAGKKISSILQFLFGHVFQFAIETLRLGLKLLYLNLQRRNDTG